MYILFAGMDYEQCGGAMDIFFTGSLSECREQINLAKEVYGSYGDGVWWHIYSTLSNKVIEDYMGD